MNFKEFYQLQERTIGLSPEELSYVDVLMERIKENCVPKLWELGYAGLSNKSIDNFDNEGFGLIIHDFEQQPFPDLRISIYTWNPNADGSYSYEPYVSTVPYKRFDSIRTNMSGIFSKKLTGRSLIEIMIPVLELPENAKLKWMEKNFVTKFFLNLISKIVMPKVKNLRHTLEHELIHYKDPSMKIRKSSSPYGLKSKKGSKETSTINYNDGERGYYTTGGEISGGVPTEFYPRIWTIIRNCEEIKDKKELLSWIRNPVPILPKCMEKETEFVKYTWENPSLRRLFLKKLYNGIMGQISPGKKPN